MEDRSQSVPLFRRSAEDLATKLAEIGTPEAEAMAREARELAAVFGTWESARPPNDLRIAKIQALFALNRRVMDFLAQRSRDRR
jgi:hypothetical protein